MKPKRVFLLLLIGAAVILTVIWSTKGISNSRPIFAPAAPPQKSSTQSPIQPQSIVKNVSSKASDTTGLQECSVVANSKVDIDTSDIYPTLNFNVSVQ